MTFSNSCQSKYLYHSIDMSYFTNTQQFVHLVHYLTLSFLNEVLERFQLVVNCLWVCGSQSANQAKMISCILYIVQCESYRNRTCELDSDPCLNPCLFTHNAQYLMSHAFMFGSFENPTHFFSLLLGETLS